MKISQKITNRSKYIFWMFLLCLVWLITILIRLLKKIKIDTNNVIDDDDVSPDYTNDPTYSYMACNIYHSDWNNDHYR
jgi:hypothetical protein